MFWSIFMQSLTVIVIILLVGYALAYVLNKLMRDR